MKLAATMSIVLAIAGLSCVDAPASTPAMVMPAAEPTAAPPPSAAQATPRAPATGADGGVQPRSMLGRWRVVGCATSPQDPANCARGEIVFEARRWSVSLPCCKRARAYAVLSTEPGKVTITSEGEVSEVLIDADGEASWRPGGLGGRVGSLSFVRDPAP